MRPAFLFLVALSVLAVPRDGQAQDPARELMQSKRIERKMTGISGMPSATQAIPATPALETTAPSTIQQAGATTQTTPVPTTTLPTMPSLEMTQKMPAPPASPLDMPTATSNIDPNQDPFKPTMRVSSYEAAYMAALRHEAEEKKKKKSLMDAIFDDITSYGLYILLGIVAFLVIYALRKEPTRPAPPKLEISPPGTEEKKDIWKDDL